MCGYCNLTFFCHLFFVNQFCGKHTKNNIVELNSEKCRDSNYSHKIDLCKFTSHACFLSAKSLRFAQLAQKSYKTRISEITQKSWHFEINYPWIMATSSENKQPSSIWMIFYTAILTIVVWKDLVWKAPKALGLSFIF